MVKKNQDFEMVSGDSRTLTFTIEDQDAGDGSAKDLSNVSELTWKLDTGVTATTVTKTLSGGGIVISDASNGIVVVTLDPSDTAGIAKGSYPHELEAVDSDGNEQTLVEGRASIIADRIA